MSRHRWVRRGDTARSCEVCGIAVELKPDRRYAWELRPGWAVFVDVERVAAGLAPTLTLLPGCRSDQCRAAPECVVRTSYGVFVRLSGEKAVQRMTPAGCVTDGELHAAVFPSEYWARRRADEFRPQLDEQHPGIEVWTAPL